MKNLYEAEDKKEYRIEEIPESDQLAAIGVFPGAVIDKERTYRFGGPAYIRFGTRRIALGKEIAKSVKVVEVHR